jgi:6-phosphogluconolactonase (cycloisomerase 2 family)
MVRLWTYREGVGLVSHQDVLLPAGSGPRHLAEHPDGRLFVDAEYSLEVFTLCADAVAGIGGVTGALPSYRICDSVAVGDPDPQCSTAEIALAEGRLYVGIRGTNEIATLDVTAGAPVLIARTPTLGDRPRHHAVLDGLLYVAHERSHDIVVFELDATSGIPGRMIQRLPIGSPTAVVPSARLRPGNHAGDLPE